MRAFLSSSRTFYGLLVLALALRVNFEINNPIITSDYAVQIEAAKNYLSNGIFSNANVSSDDLSQVRHVPLKLWPVGLAFFIILFNFFTQDLISAAICFQVLGSVLFVTGSVFLMRFLKVLPFCINLFLLLFAFNSTPFLYLGSTDLFTGALFIYSVYFALRLSNRIGNEYLNLGVVTFFGFVAAVLRFACIPNVLIIPLFLAIIAWRTKDKRYLVNSAIILIGTSILIILFYKVFPIDGSRTSFTDNIKNGVFYFSSLKWFDAFPIKAFLFTRPVEFHLPHVPLLIMFYRISLVVLSFAFLLFVLSVFYRQFTFGLRTPRGDLPQISDQVVWIFISCFMVVVGFITSQSLTVPPESNSFGPSWMPPFWTHVYSTRYFIYIICLIIILFFYGFSQSVHNYRYQKLFNFSYSVFFSWAFLFWCFYANQFYSSGGNGAGSNWTKNRSFIEAFRQVNALETDMVVIANHKEKLKQGLVTNFSKGYPTDDYLRIIEGDFRFTRPLVLVMIMPMRLNENERKFLKRHSFRFLSAVDNDLVVKIDLK